MSYSSGSSSYIAQVTASFASAPGCTARQSSQALALLATFALVLLLNPLAFPAHGVAFGRIALLLALAAAAILALAMPLNRLTRASGRAPRRGCRSGARATAHDGSGA